MNRVLKLKKSQVFGVLLGVVIAYAITAIAFIGTALLITYTNLSEGALPVILMVTCLLSVLVAGFDASRKAEKNGWAWGMAAGLIYAIIMIIIIAWVTGGFTMDFRKILIILFSLVGGGIGGAIGINFRRK